VLTRLDHVVILVGDLDRAVRGYEELGFTVTAGGEHADGLTRNALVPFADGSYLELVAFVDPDDPRDNVWGWRAFLPFGGGLIDYCAASDDLEADVRRLEEGGLGVDGPADGGRRLPDGTEIRWRVARIRQDGRLLPFLIEDLTPALRASPADPPPNTRTARRASPAWSSPPGTRIWPRGSSRPSLGTTPCGWAPACSLSRHG
jgi:catechol 2,3-dioxygenase-like lactoylglutathione lyase family enzyme